MPQFELVRAKAQMFKKTEEYYNSIRTNIQFSGRDLRVLALTSVQPSEGKTTISVNIAVSFANAGFRTLLIDADTRNSVLSGTFKANERYQGLTSFLSGNAELSDVIGDTSVPNLMIIPSGQVPPNPTSLLQSQNFQRMIETIRGLYDYVIIDTPPVGLVIDAAIIAHNTDASLLVTEAGAIKRRFIQKAVEQLQQSGTQFLGVILNKVDNTVDNYGNYGDYGSYGKQNKEKKSKKAKKSKSKIKK